MTGGRWIFRIFVAADGASSRTACSALRRLCAERLPAGDWEIEEVDLLRKPELATDFGVLAIPTVVRLQPAPMIRLIGDLSDEEIAIQVLGLPSRDFRNASR